ncbi:MAG TPA: hypothetical protein VG860_03660 [Terriglobia bacterium]|nr:hypothetical protein [Terriglobia bacterium]
MNKAKRDALKQVPMRKLLASVKKDVRQFVKASASSSRKSKSKGQS